MQYFKTHNISNGIGGAVQLRNAAALLLGGWE